jgi:23S rRNA (adenine2503-C2)-methyltransferase
LDLFALTYAELQNTMHQQVGKGAYHAAALYREVFKKGNIGFENAAEFQVKPSLALALAKNIRWPLCRIHTQQKDNATIKFITVLSDGLLVESVIISSNQRSTLCVSSQVGCRRGCRFCTTGRMGFMRNLFTAEIVWQVFAARFKLNQPIDNIVFMGMGEPLDNFSHVQQAMRIMADPRGLNIAYRHITVSTAGHAHGICKLGRLNMPNLRLAVSINAADNSLRSRLMPINRQYPLDRLKQELHRYLQHKKGLIFIEYVLLAGVNDSHENAEQLATYLKGLPVRVNVIAYNKGLSQNYASPSLEQINRFCQWLREKDLFACSRSSKGQRIRAACGQLGLPLSD